MGRTSTWAIAKEKTAASTSPMPRTMNPELRSAVTPFSAWLAGSLTSIAHCTSGASAYPVMESVPFMTMRAAPEWPPRASTTAALSMRVLSAPLASICTEVSLDALPIEVVYTSRLELSTAVTEVDTPPAPRTPAKRLAIWLLPPPGPAQGSKPTAPTRRPLNCRLLVLAGTAISHWRSLPAAFKVTSPA
jgi:hypothetical protein